MKGLPQTLLQIHIKNFSIEGKELFTGLQASVLENDAIGFIGENGTGKSTLFSLISGEESSAIAQIQKNADCKVHHVKQSEESLKDLAYEYIAQYKEEWWDVLAYLEREFRLEIKPAQMVENLSGGEFMLVKLSIGLLSGANLLLLDEPTNHLDLFSKKVLVKKLKTWEGAFVVISHDRAFLDKVIQKTWVLESKKISVYGGNYSFYREQRDLELEALENKRIAHAKKLKKEKLALEKVKKRADRERTKYTRMAKADDRSTSRAERNGRKRATQTTAGIIKTSQDKAIEKTQQALESLPVNRSSYLHAELEFDGRHGLVASVREGTLSIGEEALLQNITFDCYFGDKISISGRNGSGKSSFIKALFLEEESLHLKGVIRKKEKLSTMYIDQEYSLLNSSKNVLENVYSVNPYLREGEARRILANVGFLNPSDLYKYPENLSGGEKARLSFALATAQKIDVLILDEPTNNIDIVAKESITQLLKNYGGTLIVISHDEYLLNELDFSQTYVIDEKRRMRRQGI